MSEDDFVRLVDKLAGILFKKFGSAGHGDFDDYRQQVAVWSLEALPRFDPAAGALGAFLYKHARNRTLNAIRDRVARNDAPCKKCHAGEPCGPNGEYCRRYASWAQRNYAKANIFSPRPLSEFTEECWARPSPVEQKVEERDLFALIDAELPIHLRADYLRMLAGVKLPAMKRNRVEKAIREIFEKAGVSEETVS